MEYRRCWERDQIRFLCWAQPRASSCSWCLNLVCQSYRLQARTAPVRMAFPCVRRPCGLAFFATHGYLAMSSLAISRKSPCSGRPAVRCKRMSSLTLVVSIAPYSGGLCPLNQKIFPHYPGQPCDSCRSIGRGERALPVNGAACTRNRGQGPLPRRLIAILRDHVDMLNSYEILLSGWRGACCRHPRSLGRSPTVDSGVLPLFA